MRNKRITIACIALLATGLWACDDNGTPMDGGTDGGPRDGGPRDTGTPVDTGVDAFVPPDGGPLPTFEVRMINNVPGHAGLHVCLWGSFAGTVIADSREWLTQTTGPVPFRGVSPYLERDLVEGLDFVVGLYADVPATGCPADPFGADPAAVVAETISSASISPNSRVSVIATGFAQGTFDAAATDYPDRCGPPAFTGECPAATQAELLLVADDRTAPGDGMARLRVSAQIPNAPFGFNVCYDPVLFPNTAAAGTCLAAGVNAPEALFTNVAYETVTAYDEVDPIVPTGVPAEGVGGALYLVPAIGEDPCPPYDPTTQGCYPILAMFPPPGAGEPPRPNNIRPNVAAGDVSTIFISGVLAETGAYRPAFFIWQDNLVAASP